jgi:hypothetical protein
LNESGPSIRVLHSEVQALEREIVRDGGRVHIPPERFAGWHGRLASCPGEERMSRATELLAVAIRFHQTLGDAASMLVLQLSDLVAALLRSERAAAALLAGSGIDLRRAADLVGAPPILRARDSNALAPTGAQRSIDLRAETKRSKK